MSAPTLAPQLLRAAVFAAVCVVLSGLGHSLAACAGIALWSVAVGFLCVFAFVVLFTGRERSLPAIVGSLTLGQLGLHTLFALGQRPFGAGAVPGRGLGPEANDALIRMAAKLVCGAGAASLSPADATRIVTDAGLDPAAASGRTHAAAHLAAGAPQTTGLLPTLPMALGHLLAALAMGWLLRRGDLALRRLGQLSAEGATALAQAAFVTSLRAALTLVRALLAGLPGAPAAAPRRPVRTAADDPPPVAEALQHTVIRRGPPAGARAGVLVLVLAA
ncbi:hypothetical protein ACWGIN_17265 [Streptomyces sp. NPDC054861]